MSAPFDRFQPLVEQAKGINDGIVSLVGQAWTEGAKDGLESCAVALDAVAAALTGEEARTTRDLITGLRDEIRLRALSMTTPTPEDNTQ